MDCRGYSVYSGKEAPKKGEGNLLIILFLKFDHCSKVSFILTKPCKKEHQNKSHREEKEEWERTRLGLK